MFRDVNLFANCTVAPVLEFSHLLEKFLTHGHFSRSLREASLDERYTHHREKSPGAFILVGDVENLAYRVLPKEHIVSRGPFNRNCIAHLDIFHARNRAQFVNDRLMYRKIRSSQVCKYQILIFIARFVVDGPIVLQPDYQDQCHKECTHAYLREKQGEFPYSLVFLVVAYCRCNGNIGIQPRRNEGCNNEHHCHDCCKGNDGLGYEQCFHRNSDEITYDSPESENQQGGKGKGCNDINSCLLHHHSVYVRSACSIAFAHTDFPGTGHHR